jgi:tRNA nucleotidyltransferase (CCA-adding enzyme)
MAIEKSNYQRATPHGGFGLFTLSIRGITFDCMRIIVGHTNMDLDCLGSLALARLLYPGFKAVRSSLIHPVARNLFNLYADHLDMISVEELAKEKVEEMVIVDTRSQGRVHEYIDVIKPLPGSIHIWDHHPADSSDIPGAVMHGDGAGANTTLLGKEAMRRGIRLGFEDATIALTGIYADTGNFPHENVNQDDFAVAGWLAEQGASLNLTKTFLQTLKDESQITLFHDLLNRLVYQTVHGYLVITVYKEMDRQVGGLAAVAEKIFDVESPDALFAVFYFARENESLIIARSQQRGIDVGRLLAAFHGGGHAQASSALLKGEPGRKTFHALQACLKAMLTDAVNAASIMNRSVATISDGASLSEAFVFLEREDRTGVSVTDAAGRLCGYLSLRDIVKARRSDQLAAPVRSHMVRKVVTGTPAMSLRELESLFFSHTIYDLPIVDEGRLVGVVTRDTYLKVRAGQ